MEIIGSLDSKYYVHPNGLGFDFTSNSDITFLMFLGYEPRKTKTIKGLVDFWKKQIQKKTKFDVNIVIIGDRRDYDHYIVNYQGIEGVCDSLWELSNILFERLYLKGSTKRTIVFGDCGGAIPAMITSVKIPYHSINLTTPYMTILGKETTFDISQYTMWHSRELCAWIHDTNADFKEYFDTIDYYESYTKNSNNMLTLHWATNIIGTDKLFRDRAGMLPKRPNLKIIDHIIPNHIEGHKLVSYLYQSKKYQQMITDEIILQKISLEATK